MGKQVNVIRPNGEVMTVSEETAAKLYGLGYRPEETEDLDTLAAETAEREHYGSFEQQALAGLEGLASGATLGLADVLMEDEATQKRAQFNPGTRLAGELLGGVGLPIGAVGSAGRLASLAKYTPTGLLATQTAKISKSIGGLKGAVVGAGVEGVVAGAGAEITRTALSGDDLTVEGVLASAGLGGAFGIGAGVLSHGLELAGTKAVSSIDETSQLADDIARKAKLTKEDARIQVRDKFLPEDSFGRLRSAITGYETAADDLVRQADEAVKQMDKAAKGAAKFADGPAVSSSVKPRSAAETWMHVRSAGDQVFSGTMWTSVPRKAFKAESISVQRAFKKAEDAVRAGDDAAARLAINEYRDAVISLQSKLGGVVDNVQIPEVMGAASKIPSAVDDSVKAAKQVIDIKTVKDAVAKFPRTSEEFLKMSKGKAEQMFGALDKALKTGGPELDQFKQSLADEIAVMIERAGLVADGSPVDRLRTVYSAWRSDAVQSQVSALTRDAREARSALKRSSGGGEEGGGSPLGVIGRTLRMGTSRSASAGARRMGGGAFMSAAAYQGAGFAAGAAMGGTEGGLLGMAAMGARARITAQLQQAVAKWAPRTSRIVRTAGPRVEPLAWGATGIQDDPAEGRKELFKKRSQELAELGVVGKDRAFALASQFQAEGHDEFAVALHQKMNVALEQALTKLPRDPGKTPWGFKSLWEPTPVQLEIYARVHRAVFNPMESFEAFASGDVHPLEVEAVQAAYPGLYLEWKSQMIERLSEDGAMEKLSRQDLSELSVALDMQLSPTQRPEWIAAQQQMFAERNPKSSPNPSGAVGRPSGSSGEQATQAQLATQR